MLGLLIDAVALIVILRVVDREAPDFPTSLLAAVIMAALNLGIGFLGGDLGVLALGLMIAADAAFLRWWCELTWPRALVAVALLFIVKIASMIALGYALS